MRRIFVPILGLCVIAGLVGGPSATSAANNAKRRPQRVAGTVQDSLGRPVAGAEVSLQTSSGKIVGKTRSDAKGRFSFATVNPGTYAVTANKPSFKPAIKIAAVAAGKPAELTLAMASEQALSMTVVAKRLDVARNSLSPQTGGSVYRFNEQSIHDLPQGSNTPLNQVLLQAPGVAQDTFGQIHVRGEHADLQYRINGVQLPEGITGFGQVLSPRFAQSLNLLTGALPAENGYRTAGVVDLHSKSGLSLDGGDLDMYGGQHSTLQPSFELGGSKDKLDYFFSGQYLQSQLGVEPPTPGPSAYHDQTYQGQAFSYLSYFLNPTTR